MKVHYPTLLSTALVAGFPVIAGAQFEIASAGERQVKPVRALSYTAGEIEEVRALAREEKRFGAVYKRWFDLTTEWVNRTDAEIDALLPGDTAIYADGGTGGDPRTNQPWPKWGAGICSLDKPYEVRSPHTGDVYGISKKGAPFYDDGEGWVRESDGKRFYFRGVWNSYVMMQLLNSLDPMVNTYMLTGDEKVARRVLYLMDKMATMRSKRGTVDGPVDWPYPRRVNEGFFCLMGNQANTRIYSMSLALDMVGGSAHAQEDSWSNPGRTVFKNIQENLIRVIEPESMKDLQNHGLSAYSGFLAKALLFGEAENVRQGIEATYGFLDNCVDRDGEYYEVSASYGNLGYGYGGRLIRLLRNYAPENYEHPEAFPKREEFPYSLKFGEDPRWYSLAVKSQYRLNVLGRELSYGDSVPDRTIGNGWSSKDLCRVRDYVLYFHDLTTNPEWKEELGRIYWGLPAYLRERPTFLVSSLGLWKEPAKSQGEHNILLSVVGNSVTPRESILLGGKMTALLRSGEGKASRALFMRGGHSESHAHDDQLAITLYGRGMNVTGEFGYGFYGTPEHLGFGARAVAHKMVVVDEELPAAKRLWRNIPSAALLAFHPVPPAQVVEMSNPAQWPGTGVEVYRRESWLIDGADSANKTFYVLDLFRVKGGKRHDYLWNAPYLKPARADGGLSMEGVTPEADPKVWTLAAHWNPQNEKAEYNAKDKSWGERIIGRTGRIKDEPEADRKIGYWNPAPGNGYGFIYNIKAAETKAPWSATWALHDEASQMKLTMLSLDGAQTVVTGRSGSFEIGSYHAVVAARRKDDAGGLQSRFVSVSQLAGSNEAWPVESLAELKITETNDRSLAVAVEVKLDGGARDLILSSGASGGTIETADASLTGEKAFIRYNAEKELVAATLIRGTRLQLGDLCLKLARPAHEAEVESVDCAVYPHKVKVKGKLPAGNILEGATALFNASAGAKHPYSHNEFFQLAGVENGRAGSTLSFTGTQGVVLSTVVVEKVVSENRLQLRWPNMTGGKEAMESFTGHQLVAEGDATRSARVTALPERNVMDVDSTAPFKPGDRLQVLAIGAGDRLTIPAAAQLLRINEGEWKVTANESLNLEFPAKEGEEYILSYNQAEQVRFSGKGGKVSIAIDPVAAQTREFELKRISAE